MSLFTRIKDWPIFFACMLLCAGVVCGQDKPATDPPPSDPPTTASTMSPEKQALMRELLQLADSKKTISAMMKAQAEQMDKELPDTIWKSVAGMKELQSLTTEQREQVRLKVIASSRRTSRRMNELMEQRIDFNKLVEDVSLPLYDKYFTEGELRDLLAFYKSNTGRKVIEVMPNLMSESITRTTTIIMPKLTEIMTEMYQEETQRMEKEIQETVKTQPKTTKPPARSPRKRGRH